MSGAEREMRHREWESTPSSLGGGYNSEGHRKFILPRGCMEIAQHSGDMELILTLQDKRRASLFLLW